MSKNLVHLPACLQWVSQSQQPPACQSRSEFCCEWFTSQVANVFSTFIRHKVRRVMLYFLCACKQAASTSKILNSIHAKQPPCFTPSPSLNVCQCNMPSVQSICWDNIRNAAAICRNIFASTIKSIVSIVNHLQGHVQMENGTTVPVSILRRHMPSWHGKMYQYSFIMDHPPTSSNPKPFPSDSRESTFATEIAGLKTWLRSN